jgi:nitroreductase
MDFNDLIKKRASVRSYSSNKIKIEDILELIDTANLSPTPGNLGILRYIIIEDPDKIYQISEACQQRFIANAPFIIIVCSDSKECNIMYDTRAKKYVSQHAGAAIQTLLLKITDMDLASCWIGAFSESTIKDLLAIPDNIEIEAIIPVAYESKVSHTKQKRKPSLEKRVYFEKWKNKYKLSPSKIRRDDV